MRYLLNKLENNYILPSLKKFFNIVSKKPISEKNIKNIWNNSNIFGICIMAGIGDAIMATPIITAIKKSKPNSKLIVICTNTTKPVLITNNYVDRLIVIDKYHYSHLLKLLYLPFIKIDLLFFAQPSNTFFHSLISFFSFPTKTIKTGKDITSKVKDDFSNFFNLIIPFIINEHRVISNLKLLNYFNKEIDVSKYGTYFRINKNILSEYITRNINFKTDYIIIHPGSADSTKRWDTFNFIKLIDLIFLHFKHVKIIIVGGKNEEEHIKIFDENRYEGKLINVVCKTSLEETAFLLKISKLLITNDSGVMHLATTQSTPILALFGDTNPNNIGPYTYNTQSTIIQNMTSINLITPYDVLQELINFYSLINDRK